MLTVGACPHLDEHEGVLMLANEIDLAAVTEVIVFEDFEAEGFEMRAGQALGAGSDGTRHDEN